jgi:hypothetical protein
LRKANEINPFTITAFLSLWYWHAKNDYFLLRYASSKRLQSEKKLPPDSSRQLPSEGLPGDGILKNERSNACPKDWKKKDIGGKDQTTKRGP